jgi:N-acetylglucosaminyl-diphospho-decaprenol L-rhamnosyltransferase
MVSLFPKPDGNAAPDVSVIVVSYNTQHLLARTLTALDTGRGQLRLQVIVVDNASRDGSVEYLRKEFPNVELVENLANVGFGRANNLALSRIRGRYVLLLNTDAFVSSDTLPRTVSYMDQHPRSGVLGVKLVGENGALQPSCLYFPTPWNIFLKLSHLERFFKSARLVDDDHDTLRACDWVRGCYYLIRREVIDSVGLFDPRYFLYYEEVDHCRRVRQAGWEVIYYPYAPVVHIGGESARSYGRSLDGSRQISTLHTESELLYFRKHFGLLGLLASVFLTTLTYLGLELKRILQRRDADQAQAPLNHAWLVIKLLFETRLASRPTQ